MMMVTSEAIQNVALASCVSTLSLIKSTLQAVFHITACPASPMGIPKQVLGRWTKNDGYFGSLGPLVFSGEIFASSLFSHGSILFSIALAHWERPSDRSKSVAIFAVQLFEILERSEIFSWCFNSLFHDGSSVQMEASLCILGWSIA